MYTISEIGDIAGPVNMESLKAVHVNGPAKLVAERYIDGNWVVGTGTPPFASELFRLRVIEPGLTTVEFITEL